jgi:hypothetical protein
MMNLLMESVAIAFTLDGISGDLIARHFARPERFELPTAWFVAATDKV